MQRMKRKMMPNPKKMRATLNKLIPHPSQLFQGEV